jgi:hypothetical protein
MRGSGWLVRQAALASWELTILTPKQAFATTPTSCATYAKGLRDEGRAVPRAS